ncbi:MAG TPA: proton-conducting transporter membrane subunit [Acidimicrobiia bacterium]|nr:proton-conducting transporter membrane subunit [Acidimicrobiia bacterium]
MNPLLVLPIALPLGTAALTIGLVRWPVLRRALGATALGATIVSCFVLLGEVADGTVLVGHVGAVSSPIGITLVADTFAAILLTISAIMLLAVFIYAVGSPKTDETRAFFHSVYLILAAGVSASFLTGDLFNLFVAFEVTLTASYVLITFGGSRLQIRHGMTYVVISLLASTLFITAVGLVYAATGTVNMADLASKLADIDPGLRSALGVLFLVVFGVKAAIFPLFFWLPDSYPVAASPVTAIFAGLLTKVGVYAIIRSHTLLFGESGPSTLLLVVAGLTMVTGVLGAITQNDVKRILSFHIISQIGYMIFGLGLYTLAGLAATVFYIVHHIIVKTTLFLVGGLIEEQTGTGGLRRLGGLLHTSPLLAALFLLPALSLAGIPPLSGFVAKLALIEAGFSIGAFTTVGVAISVSALTLFSMTKIWSGVFWGKAEEPPPNPVKLERSSHEFPRLMMFPTAFLVALSIAYVVAAAPIYELGEVAAAGLVDPSGYISAVMAP